MPDTLQNSISILIVEDNPGDYLLLQEYLRLTGIAVKEVINATSMGNAAKIIKEKTADIVLLDLTLPDSYGVDSIITMDRLLPNTPIVVFSGLSDISVAIESIALGAQDYLIKGEFNEKLLAKTIQYSIERKKTQEILRSSNERYEYINRVTHDILWEWDLATNTLTWNHSLAELLEYDESEVLNDHGWWIKNMHKDDMLRMQEKMKFCVENKLQTWQDEYRIVTKTGQLKYLFDRAYCLCDAKGKPYRMIGAMTDITERKEMELMMAEQQLMQQKLNTELTIQAQEKERNELGLELHDNINQILATVKMYLSMAKTKEDMREELLGSSYNYVVEAMEEIRKLSHSLVAPSLGGSNLQNALLDLVKEINSTCNIEMKLYYKADAGKSFGEKIELMLYRIVQEQINNICKHSGAKDAFIIVEQEAHQLILSISDNGMGFDISKRAMGIGLKNIKSRLELYAGKMEIDAEPGKGCAIVISIPLENNQHI